jgi:hypothetical protein
MALTASKPDTPPPPGGPSDVTGVVAGLGRGSSRGSGPSTEVVVRAGDGGITLVDVPGRPDRAAAERVGAGLRRLVWQRIEVAGPEVRCTVRGVRHRLPCERSVSLGAALGLAERGLPTVVHVVAAGAAGDRERDGEAGAA